MNKIIAEKFERGIDCYFRDFGHRQARELPHQTWLAISVAKHIEPRFIAAEMQVPNQDLCSYGSLKNTGGKGAVNFDITITRSEIDLRAWKTQTPGWNLQNPTTSRTLSTLCEAAVIAELKIAGSTATNTNGLEYDLRKLSCAMRFLKAHDCESFPACYLVIHDPAQKFNSEYLLKMAQSHWPQGVPLPRIRVGPKPS